MEKKQLHEKMRQDLIQAAVRAVADYGMEGAKTRTIASICNINESYIYRYFIDRDDLLEKTFIQLDHNFFEMATDATGLMSKSADTRTNFRKFFDAIMDYSVRDLAYTAFYTRYYMSASYTQNAMAEHGKDAHTFSKMFSRYFASDEDTYLVCHTIFIMLLGYLMEIINGSSTDSEHNRDLFFEMVFSIFHATKNKQ